jgi:hypothetical protein
MVSTLRDQFLTRQGAGVCRTWSVLKPGGRLATSNVLALKPVSTAMRDDELPYNSCASGAALVTEVEALLRTAGFNNILVKPKPESSAVIQECFPGNGLEN